MQLIQLVVAHATYQGYHNSLHGVAGMILDVELHCCPVFDDVYHACAIAYDDDDKRVEPQCRAAHCTNMTGLVPVWFPNYARYNATWSM